MRLLITGGAGFIGSHLCERFLADGHTVLCVDNFITGSESNIAHLVSQTGFELVRHDMAKPLECSSSIECVLHFASPASPRDYLAYPIQTLKVGSLGTLHALGMAKAKRASFLLASTSEVYGDPQVHPQPETYWGYVNCVGPRGVYDEAKRFAEALTMAYHQEYGVNTKIARIFNTFGSRMRLDDGRAVPTFIRQALKHEPLTIHGDGTQTRSFCEVSDLIDGLCRLLASPVHEPINLGNSQELTIRALAEQVIRLCESRSTVVFMPRPQDDPTRRSPDLERARRLLDWEPKIPFEVGLQRVIAWYRQNGQPASASRAREGRGA